MKKQRLNRILLLLIIILIIACCVCVYFSYFKNDTKTQKKKEDEIEGYGYKLYDRDSENYKKLFYQLKDILNSSVVDEDEYIKVISQMFVMDFYTLKNKTSSDDVGGVDFVYSDVLTNFKDKAKDTVYLYLENYLTTSKKKNLPVVDDVLVEKVENTTYNYLEKTDKKAYKVTVEISYEKDLGYTSEATLYFVHEGKKLSLVEVA